MWNTASGERERKWRLPPPPGKPFESALAVGNAAVRFDGALAVAPDNKTVAIMACGAIGIPHSLWLFDLENGDARRRNVPEFMKRRDGAVALPFNFMAFAADSQSLKRLVNLFGGTGVWDLRTTRITHLIPQAKARHSQVARDPHRVLGGNQIWDSSAEPTESNQADLGDEARSDFRGGRVDPGLGARREPAGGHQA